jgi:site-specific recombinase XerD
MGNSLTREQGKELLAVPDHSTVKGKRAYVILALPVRCAHRRQELATLEVEKIQLRQGRWVLSDLEGKTDSYRRGPSLGQTGDQRLDDCSQGRHGRLLRPLSKSDKILGEELGDWAI